MNGRAVAVIVAGVALVGGATAYLFVTSPAATPPAKPIAATEPPSLPPSVLRGRTSGATAAAPAESARARRPSESAAIAAPADSVAAPAAASSTLGSLHFETDVPGVEVFIDRILIGVAPITVSDLKPGPHRLNLSLPGYEPVSETIEVAPGLHDMVFKFREVRLDAKLEVVHKHRIGSCKGTLIATPRGLRYETTDKDDAFSVPLTDLDTLEIDYLEKRLRIGTRSKRYDFTDPEGNADRLFVFHRDVEKARDRLRKGDPPAP